MSAQALFGISVAVSFIAWAVVMRQYLWPALRSQSRTNALRPILLLHSFRFVGLAFLVPESSRRICRQPTRVRPRTVILRLRSLLAGDRGAAPSIAHNEGLAIDYLLGQFITAGGRQTSSCSELRNHRTNPLATFRVYSGDRSVRSETTVRLPQV